jgi:UDPglucose 6-dehydrogenase
VSTRIAVIGTGYVGLTTGVCLAHFGHDVVCADVDADKVARLTAGQVPIVEAGLAELLAEGLATKRLRFVVGNAQAVADRQVVFLCVPTPQGEDGSADLSYLQNAARDIGPHLAYESIVVNKSTVPVGSTKVVEQVLGRPDVRVVSNPEFLREGSAVQDFLRPDRVVVGASDQAAALVVAELYERSGAPQIITDPASAETIKYAANAFLATKLSFVNAIAAICEGVGADVNDVMVGLGSDHRIGHDFLRPGPGWGGSCFDGAETVMVRRHGEERLIRFDELTSLTWSQDQPIEVLSWSHDGVRPEYQPVLATSVREYDGDMVTIRTKMGRRLTVTADHPMVAVRGYGGEPQVVLAGELSRDHWLPLALGDPLHEPLDPRLSIVEALFHADIAWRDVILRTTHDVRQRFAHSLGLLSRPQREQLRRGGTLRLDSAALLRWPLTDLSASTVTNGAYVPAVLDLDARFWRVLGLFLAEGHINQDGRRKRLMWSFHPRNEQHLVDEVADYWRSLGVRVHVRASATAMNVVVSSRILASLFENVLRTGRNAYDHRIPDLAWQTNDEGRLALLSGLWQGDGSWSLVKGGPSVVLEYGTVSRNLADGIVRLLAGLGIVARLKVGRVARSTVDTYWLVVSGADQVELMCELLGSDAADRVRASVGTQTKRIAPTGYRRDGKGTAWVRVVGVEHERRSQLVHSVEVARHHTVVTSFGLVAHNCFPKDTRALLKIADDAGYRFDMLEGVLSVNDEQFDRMADKVRVAAGGALAGRTVAVWGLTFKARTDDLRDSPSLAVIERVVAQGASVQAFDPTVAGPKPGLPHHLDVRLDPYAACEGADVLVVLTEWDEFRWVEPSKVAQVMTGRAVVDTRNLLERNQWQRAGFHYQGVGR